MAPQTILSNIDDRYTSSELCLSPFQRPWTTHWIVAVPRPTPILGRVTLEKGQCGKGQGRKCFLHLQITLAASEGNKARARAAATERLLWVLAWSVWRPALPALSLTFSEAPLRPTLDKDHSLVASAP